MLFIPRIWSSETERIGKKKCTKIGYALHSIADSIGGIGFLLLIGLLIRLIVCAFSEDVFPTYWLFAIPLAIGITSRILIQYSWYLASRKSFEYDYKTDTAVWNENGQQVKYKYAVEN